MRFIFAMLGVLAWAGPAASQTWTRDRGSAYVEANVARVSSSSVYGPDFRSRPLASRYTQVTIGSYAELGVIDRWLTATLATELLRVNTLDNQGRTFGLGDTRVGLWTGLLTAPVRLTAGLWVGIPTGDPSPSSRNQETEAVARSLPTGDGEWDVEPQLRLGWSFSPSGWPLAHYAQVALGYQLRTHTELFGIRQDIADAVTYSAELGTQYRQLDRVWLSAKLYGVESFASNRDAGASAVGLGNGVTYTAYQARLFVRLIGGVGVAAAVESAVRARSIVAAPVFRLAVSYQTGS